MQLLTVIPLTRGNKKGTLSYYTAKDILPGALVSVPLQRRIVPAIVVSSDEVSVSKAEIKNASFGFKKISAVKHGNFFTPAFMRAAKRAARYFATTPGAVIDSLVPRSILDEPTKMEALPDKQNEIKDSKHTLKLKQHEKFIFQEAETERFATYKSLIREEFANGRSVFLCLPTVSDIERATPELKRGIESYVFMLHGELGKKQILETWGAVLSTKHPVLITATGLFLSIPREDIGTIILEHEGNESYKTLRRPFLDFRIFSKFLAEEGGKRLIFGDIMLRTETMYAYEKREFLPFSPPKFRVQSESRGRVVTIGDHHHKPEKKKQFTLISRELTELVEKVCKTKERLFVLVSRKGLYPLTLCDDCGATVLCVHCTAPMVLHRKNTDSARPSNVFVCRKCGVKKESVDICVECGSWRLTPLGIGTERVEEELRKVSPEITVFRFDKTAASTQKKANALATEFTSTPAGVLVGTKMALSYLPYEIPYVAVASLDALFMLPDFRINEQVFRLLIELRTRASKEFLIQTRMPELPLFSHAIRGDILSFYREELANRKTHSYPPFGLLIKVTRTGSEVSVLRDMEKFKELFTAYEPLIYPAFVSRAKGAYSMHALLRLDKKNWPNDNILSLFAKLPPSFQIQVDPESIL